MTQSNQYKFLTRWRVRGTPEEVFFAANHRWAMARGEESLQLELARRYAATPAERGRIPAPPGPIKHQCCGFLSELWRC